MTSFRTERDSLGEVKVPETALWGAQTQRALDNFNISGQAMPADFIRDLALIKACAAQSNAELGLLDASRAEAISRAAMAIAEGDYADQFPVDVFQTGSGTSSNMNMNEVISHIASSASDVDVHPNDHVNLGQSSNDTIPSALHLSAARRLNDDLLPALIMLESELEKRERELWQTAKTGRTHLMDAMPVTLGQEIGAWRHQIQRARHALQQRQSDLHCLAQGATAVGSGVNADPGFGDAVCRRLSEHTGLDIRTATNRFAALSNVDTALGLSGDLKQLASALMKIANDLRWMNSGPLAGLGEISLKALQPGSSIMPGKVNPVIPEAVAMVAADCIGNDAAITIAAQSGNFQLNVMLPLVAQKLLHSLTRLAAASRSLARDAIADFSVNTDNINQALHRNPVLITALNSEIGYDRAAEIAKQAWREQRPILEVAIEQTDLSEAQLQRLLDPQNLAFPHNDGNTGD